MSASDPVVSRLVVRPPNWLGDAVLALPALGAIRRAWPDAHLTIAAPPGLVPLFRETSDAAPDAIVELLKGNREAASSLRQGRFDLGLLFPNSFRSAWQFWRAGIPARWGYATAARGSLLTRRASLPPPASRRHQADYYRCLVRAFGIACDDAPPRLAASTASLERARALLVQQRAPLDRPLVGIAPGAAYGPAKQWPSARMAELSARIVREHDAAIVLVGAAHDRPVAREIESWCRANAPAVLPRLIDLVGRTNLGALVGVASHTAAFVSNDSGAMHVAAAVGRPVIAIFGPTDERATGPLGGHDVLVEPVFCRPCLLRDCPIDHRCMKRITVDSVFRAVSTRLAAAERR
jgi:heptosyltransferase-2